MRKYKKIIGGTKEDAEKKFPWLKKAKFKNAIIDINSFYLVWKDGIWEFGIWKFGIWGDGVWESGTWKDGVWKGGRWKKGYMWSNSKQKYVRVEYENGKFVEIDETIGETIEKRLKKLENSIGILIDIVEQIDDELKVLKKARYLKR